MLALSIRILIQLLADLVDFLEPLSDHNVESAGIVSHTADLTGLRLRPPTKREKKSNASG